MKSLQLHRPDDFGSSSVSQETCSQEVHEAALEGGFITADVLGLVLQYCTYEEMFFERSHPTMIGTNYHRESIFKSPKTLEDNE